MPIIMFSPSIHCVDLYVSSLFYVMRIKHFFALTRTEEIKWKVKEDQEKKVCMFFLKLFFSGKKFKLFAAYLTAAWLKFCWNFDYFLCIIYTFRVLNARTFLTVEVLCSEDSKSLRNCFFFFFGCERWFFFTMMGCGEYKKL